MRLDLYLKHTRLIKRRTAAQERASEGGVLLNGRPAKKGKDVKAGDVITLLDDEGASARRVVIVQPALRPVPKGREPDFFKVIEDGRGPHPS